MSITRKEFDKGKLFWWRRLFVWLSKFFERLSKFFERRSGISRIQKGGKNEKWVEALPDYIKELIIKGLLECLEEVGYHIEPNIQQDKEI